MTVDHTAMPKAFVSKLNTEDVVRHFVKASSLNGRNNIRMVYLGLTDDRVVVVSDLVISKTTIDIPYSEISTVQSKSGLASARIEIETSASKPTQIGGIPKNSAGMLVDFIRESMAAPSQVSITDMAVSNDLVEQLQRLADLRESGVLNEDEFASAKARLLEEN